MRSRTFIVKGYGKGRDRFRDVDLRVTNIQGTVNKYWMVGLDRNISIYLETCYHAGRIQRAAYPYRGAEMVSVELQKSEVVLCSLFQFS